MIPELCECGQRLVPRPFFFHIVLRGGGGGSYVGRTVVDASCQLSVGMRGTLRCCSHSLHEAVFLLYDVPRNNKGHYIFGCYEIAMASLVVIFRRVREKYIYTPYHDTQRSLVGRS